MTDKIYVDQDGSRVQVARRAEGFVFFYPQGGGFEHKAPEATFEARFKPVDEAFPFKEVLVEAEWLPEGCRIRAYSDGNRWNGWAQPYFPLDEALRLAKEMENLSYDEANDRFVINNEGYEPPDDIEFVEPVTLSVAGQDIKTYPIGAGSWCWWLADD